MSVSSLAWWKWFVTIEQKKIKSLVPFMAASTVVLLVGNVLLNLSQSAYRSDLSNLVQQIRAGVVGEKSSRNLLEKFTDFVNEFGVRPSTVSNGLTPQ